MTAPWREGWWDSFDGLRLHYRDYHAAPPGLTPVLCLPGLSRGARDFAPLAERLAPARRVIAPEMRGRGRSAWDANPANYALGVEIGDILGLLDLLGLERVAVVGVSRGGLQAMVIATLRPALFAGAALVDVGPRLERAGLARLLAGLRATPARLADWDAAAAALRDRHGDAFVGLSPADWLAFARRIYADQDGAPVRDFDPELPRAAEAALAEAPEGDLPELWPQFEALAARPCLALRGAHSDLLSDATLAEMARRQPAMAVVTVPDRGHAPFLDEPSALAALAALLHKADAWTPPPTPTAN